MRLFLSDDEHQFVNVAMAGVKTPRVSTKLGELSEQWGEEVTRIYAIIFCYRVLTDVFFLGRPSSLQSRGCFNDRFGSHFSPCRNRLPLHSKLVHQVLLPQRRSLSAMVSAVFVVSRKRTVHHALFAVVIHPVGNIAEHLIAAGFARVLDWHAGILASSGGMERLRAAEKVAKEKKLYLYANLPMSSGASKTNGNSAGGSSRNFDATVIRVWSGDQLSVMDKDGKERRIQLSSTRAPKCVIFFPLRILLMWLGFTLTRPLDNPILSRLTMPTKPGSS